MTVSLVNSTLRTLQLYAKRGVFEAGKTWHSARRARVENIITLSSVQASRGYTRRVGKDMAKEFKKQEFDYFLVLDFEATCDNNKKLIPQVPQHVTECFRCKQYAYLLY